MTQSSTNPMLRAWAEGRPLFGIWMTTPSMVGAEFAAREGADYVCVDNQHGLIDFSDTVPMLVGITAGGSIPVVRVTWNQPAPIMAALDAGAFGVIIPMVNDAQEAERAVGACRFPPRGMRSYGPVRAKYPMGTADPVELNEVACIVMVETVGGIAHVEDIVSTPGVDAVYIGPSDLALAVGQKPGPRPYDDLAEPVGKIKAACRRHGVALGIHALSGDVAARWAEAGFDMITVGSDAGMFAAAARSYLETARRGLEQRSSADEGGAQGR
jgi:4-hydroxy-2-oxoheptanedioate aldolase